MGWVLLFVTVLAFLVAIGIHKKNPKISLIVAAVVPFVCFYVLGKNNYDNVFIMFAILYFVFTNGYFFYKNKATTS